ncbi:potassium-transporting ATPase subunit KdpC [Azorhizophilus paspali]|uniref:Potassium-transporting ATPase KdpC subunit n=1 Tax=Azorhizophilus paspali TaxID=69963 RepID=A0ABV6SN53_AZOPA
MKTLVRPAVSLFLMLSAVTGLAYPLAVTGIARTVFPEQAAGSLIIEDGRAVGSELIGQHFDSPRYFWGRPSATASRPYNAVASSGSNQGPLNPALVEAVGARIEALRVADPGNTRPVPVDLVTASASGLDPHISPAAALWQVSRVARARSLPEEQVGSLVESHTEGRQWWLLGEPRVNVLKLNRALDDLGR